MNPLSYYVDLSYLINLRPDPLGPTGRIGLPLAAIGMIAAAAALRGYAFKSNNPITKHGYLRMSRPLLTMGILGAMYAVFAFIAVPLFSMRLILAVGVVITVIWIGTAAWREYRSQPKKLAERERKLQLQKYLPK